MKGVSTMVANTSKVESEVMLLPKLHSLLQKYFLAKYNNLLGAVFPKFLNNLLPFLLRSYYSSWEGHKRSCSP